ncbi:hypothetical protein F994_02440 [Acinetobacter bohemicus ANC 3994]|uniref:Uncharacterized protein n=1 Tax=Acinetobacter bohemicus ANC 3994 TaxID=1217715 RepID=N8NZK1_9GAMM|nr:hypothetical protein [Acinetobacter bohemicus]ENU19580.1 hypothetical protein F994_02440 [Acinetobacter bohemicus ANC 3994]
MTQADSNTPETATTSKRVTKPKTTAAKAAVDTEVLAPVETEQSPLLDAAVNQEKISSQAELQGMQSDTAGQSPVADVEPDNGNQEISVTADTESSSPEIPASSVNESVGTEQVLPKVQSPSPVKQTTVAKSGLFVVVKNTGVQTVFEPLSKTSIKSGETVEIRCSTGQFKHDVLNNLKQFIGLGKNLEIQNA